MRAVIVMEWNSKTPLEWDLENLALYRGRTFETPTSLQFSSHEIDEVKENGRIYSSGVGSGSDLRHGSTSRNSFSASADASVKEGLQSFSAVDGFPTDVSKKEEFWGVDDGNFPSMGACLGSGVPMTGLKLGRLTYLEDMSAGSTAKTTAKRTRQSHQSMQTRCCQVEGCNLDLVSAKGYHRRHKICESHSKSPKVIVAGMERRFCQQCSRFHDLSEFDDQKRSCRRRLSNHNARRRRSQLEATRFNSTQLYDQRPRMNFLLNRIPMPVANHTWGIDCHLKGTSAADSLITPAKVGKNAISSVELITPKTLYSDASAITSTLDVQPELRHAPSLLSSNSWASNER